MTLVHEDHISCDGCGAEIVHLICGASPTHEQNPEYYLCDSCTREDDAEPNQNDTVLCCPDCERPNQFGELCQSCQSSQDAEAEAEGQRWADEHENAPCMWWGGR